MLVDADDGTIVDSCTAPHPPGTEVEPRSWLSALEAATDGLLGRADAVSVARQQHGMVALDAGVAAPVLDVVGEVTAIVDNASELLAWATTLTDPALVAWRAADSGSRYLQVSAIHAREPIRGQITAVLRCDQHPEFWRELCDTHDLDVGDRTPLSFADLSRAWQAIADHPANLTSGPPRSTRPGPGRGLGCCQSLTPFTALHPRL